MLDLFPLTATRDQSIQLLAQVPKNVLSANGARSYFHTCPKCMERCSRTRVAEKSMICVREFHVDACLFRFLGCASTYQRQKRSQLLKESKGGHGLKAVCADRGTDTAQGAGVRFDIH
jgi:hypothetical protein